MSFSRQPVPPEPQGDRRRREEVPFSDSHIENIGLDSKVQAFLASCARCGRRLQFLYRNLQFEGLTLVEGRRNISEGKVYAVDYGTGDC